MPAAYQPQADLVDGQILVIGQWNIAGQTATPHWFCVQLPQGDWTMQNESGQLEDAQGEVIAVSVDSRFVLTQPEWVWVKTWSGAQLRGPAWRNLLPSLRR